MLLRLFSPRDRMNKTAHTQYLNAIHDLRGRVLDVGRRLRAEDRVAQAAGIIAA